MKLTWLRSHSLVILLLIFSATFTILHDATLGTIARGVHLLWNGTIATFVHRRIEDHEARCHQ